MVNFDGLNEGWGDGEGQGLGVMGKVFSLNLCQTFLKTLIRSVVLTEAGRTFQYKTTFSETVDISILWVGLGLAEKNMAQSTLHRPISILNELHSPARATDFCIGHKSNHSEGQ